MSTELEIEAVELYRAGQTMKAVAEQLLIPVNTVRDWVHDAGIARGKGFAGMNATRLREISSKGGFSVPPANRSFSRNPALARSAGRLGGLRTQRDLRA